MAVTLPFLVLSAVLACNSVDYRTVDLQVDVIGPVPVDAETLHMCVVGSGELSEGAGNGRVLFAGLHADQPASITIAFVDETGHVIGGAGPLNLDDGTPWAEVEQDQRDEDCTDEGIPAAADEESWVLGVRFTGETW